MVLWFFGGGGESWDWGKKGGGGGFGDVEEGPALVVYVCRVGGGGYHCGTAALAPPSIS